MTRQKGSCDAGWGAGTTLSQAEDHGYRSAAANIHQEPIPFTHIPDLAARGEATHLTGHQRNRPIHVIRPLQFRLGDAELESHPRQRVSALHDVGYVGSVLVCPGSKGRLGPTTAAWNASTTTATVDTKADLTASDPSRWGQHGLLVLNVQVKPTATTSVWDLLGENACCLVTPQAIQRGSSRNHHDQRPLRGQGTLGPSPTGMELQHSRQGYEPFECGCNDA